MAHPDPAALALLVAVADHGSVSGAAKQLGVAQPSASRTLSRLERRLGVQLLTRTTTGSRLTGAGLSVVQWAREVLAAYERLDAAAALLTAGDSTRLAVAASQTIAEHLLPRWLGALRETQPGTSVTVSVGNSADVVRRLADGSCDLGFVEGPTPPTGVHSTPVARDELVLVVAPGHPWARRRAAVTADELGWTPLVVREPGSGTRVALEKALAAARVTTVPPALATTSNAAVRVAVSSGLAPAVLSRLAVADALAAGSLVEVPCEVRLPRTLRAAWTGPRQLTGAAASLVGLARGRGQGRS